MLIELFSREIFSEIMLIADYTFLENSVSSRGFGGLGLGMKSEPLRSHSSLGCRDLGPGLSLGLEGLESLP